MKIGILREGKQPPDKRVALSPKQCKTLLNLYPKVSIEVQSSSHRCFSDEEYEKEGITVKADISSCDFFLGVKEVMVDDLLPDKSYMFFSHTIKKQPQNSKLLKAILDRNIRLIDIELLQDSHGARLIGFGRYAGLVGAYNAFATYGLRHQLYQLKPVEQCEDKLEMFREVKKVKLPNVKLLVTGNGRVANGVLEVLEELAIRRLSINDYLNNKYDEPCYVQLSSGDYNVNKHGLKFDIQHFFKNPSDYKGNFKRFYPMTNMLISAAYWDPKAPVLFDVNDMQQADFNIEVVADITCDINGSIPTTIRATKLDNMNYDYNPTTAKEEPAFSNKKNITVMAVDNLPSGLPKDASREFGNHLNNRVLDYIINRDREGVIERATIAESGQLKERFKYLRDYANS